MANGVVELNHTVKVLGKEVRVPITYAKEDAYFVFTATTYRVRVARTNRTQAWKDFSEKIAQAVEANLKARL